MSGGAPALRRLFNVWDEGVIAPADIEDVIADFKLSDHDNLVERLAMATQVDLGDIPRAITGSMSLSAEDALHLARRLGWSVKVLADWTPQQDPSGFRLEAALASVAAWNAYGGFWEAAQSRLQGVRAMIAGLEVVLRRRVPSAEVLDDAPIWEREHLLAMQEAERAGDWPELGKRVRAFERLPRADAGARQAALALSVLDWPRLVGLANRSEGWLHAHFIMEPLPLADALRLAVASNSGYARFAALERVAYREVRILQAQEETALRNLLIVLAKDLNNWQQWLSICNQYPVRHPHMQAAFGRTLARSGADALKAYVDSISMGSSNGGMRETVTHCLSVFRARAKTARRLALWRAAFERWKVWDFAANDKQQMLSNVVRSVLDYGVVGWLVEGEPGASLADLEHSFEEELSRLETRWHSSQSSAISDFFRMISRHQLSAHAAGHSAADEDWLPGPAVYLPPAATDPYIQRRYPRDERQL